MSDFTFTVFTPAYNRAGLLPRVHQSLLEQTFGDFEWLIVDDGSSDDTRSVVEPWIAGSPFPVRYLYKENGGKHTALNVGIREARGRYFVVADSDDWLLPEALETLLDVWNGQSGREKLTGVCGLFQYPDGQVVGTRFPEDGMRSNAIDLRLRHGVKGDKVGFSRIEVLREFPFPEEFGRVYLPESIVWNRISQRYDTVFVNRMIGVKEYQQHGITDRAGLNSARNPLAYRLKAAELVTGSRRIPFLERCRCLLTATKCSIKAGVSPFVSTGGIDPLLTVGSLPVALVLLARDRMRAARMRQRSA